MAPKRPKRTIDSYRKFAVRKKKQLAAVLAKTQDEMSSSSENEHELKTSGPSQTFNFDSDTECYSESLTNACKQSEHTSELWNALNEINDNCTFDSESDENDSKDLCSDLSDWALQHNITTRAQNDLLRILRLHNMNVPKDSRTLLKTPRSGSIEIKQCSGGDYI